MYNFFRRANKKDLWNKILEHIVKVTRAKIECNSGSSYALIDYQSVKTVYASEQIEIFSSYCTYSSIRQFRVDCGYKGSLIINVN